MKTTSILQFGKAQISSLVATGCDFLLTAVLYHFAACSPGFSTCCGAICGGIVNCVINAQWTFRGSGRSRSAIAMRYLLVWVGSILLNTFGTMLGVNLLDGGETRSDTSLVMAVKAVVALLVAVLWNFTMQKYFVYKKVNE
ncbi:MAG: GtrA family protein [Prevotellaceae bacterium]|nr:GtrA family protein [Prevotellaceae bacterium]